MTREEKNKSLELLLNIELTKIYIIQKELLENILYADIRLNNCGELFGDLEKYKKYNNNLLTYCENIEKYLVNTEVIKNINKDLNLIK